MSPDLVHLGREARRRGRERIVGLVLLHPPDRQPERGGGHLARLELGVAARGRSPRRTCSRSKRSFRNERIGRSNATATWVGCSSGSCSSQRSGARPAPPPPCAGCHRAPGGRAAWRNGRGRARRSHLRGGASHRHRLSSSGSPRGGPEHPGSEQQEGHGGETLQRARADERVTASPATTASPAENTSAEDAPRKTAQREAPPAEKVSVASWVLSPSSASNTVMKVVPSSFQSKGYLHDRAAARLLPRNRITLPVSRGGGLGVRAWHRRWRDLRASRRGRGGWPPGVRLQGDPSRTAARKEWSARSPRPPPRRCRERQAFRWWAGCRASRLNPDTGRVRVAPNLGWRDVPSASFWRTSWASGCIW